MLNFYKKKSVFLFLFALVSGLGFAEQSNAQQLGIYTFTGASATDSTFAIDAQPANARFSNYMRGDSLTIGAGSDYFNSASWPTANALSVNDYHAFSVTPVSGYTVSLDSIVLDERRSGTGIRVWSVRSSADNFATDIATFNVPDDTNTRRQKISLGSAFQNLSSMVEFRIYGWSAESANGTWRHDNVAVFGATAVAGGTTTNCGELFISEYVEGSSNNKALEIYNPTNQTINLSNYRLELFGNGNTTGSNALVMNGMLASGDVYVIANPSADPAILAIADTTHSVTFYNGDDAIALIKGNDTLDIIGVIGQRPTPNWTVGTGATSEFTLVRMQSVQTGQKNWTVGATEWNVHPQNTFSFLGAHTSSCISAPTSPIVAFASASATVAENVGTATVTLNIANPLATDTVAVRVRVSSASTATAPADYTFTDTVVVWQANDAAPKVISLTIVDDAVVEPNETIVLTLANPTNGAVLGAATHTLTITDNDAPAPVIPIYTISQLTGIDANGVADSLNVVAGVRGIIYGDNQRATGSGYQFTIHDNTDGIGFFKGSNYAGITLAEGDSVLAYGKVTQFNGLTQLTVDSVFVIAQNRTLRQPTVVTVLDETTESELIRLANPVTVVTPSQWNLTGTGASIDVTDGTNTYVMRIDNDSDFFTSMMPVPTGPFFLTGIGGQFDSSTPLNSGYQIMPRRMSDLNFNVGVKAKLNAAAVTVYPNPAKDQLTINLGEEATKAVQVVIYNTLGQQVITTSVTGSETTVQVATLPAGVYTIHIASDNKIAVKQFIKAN
ncbi:MAG: T9SS type A sorting domain-containing protein [Hymenobacteraceae bacterium]|nr:T9SS type A sorting domain-containing protein [Hymenobacteraceae bacterium]MDX5397459.1 T9SS type A sorting domain-containing protein [Hymenobacteraceae bacterium]MDX5513537.1 T9SS type A sorting domain-containing protein [Hymenobacteraceae bacterium]